MSKILTLTFLIMSFTSFTQEVKFKKGNILVDGIVWCKYEKTGNIEFYRTVNDQEYLSAKYYSCGTGEFYKGGTGGNQDIERRVHYNIIHFFNTDIAPFEIGLDYKEIIRALRKEKVLDNGVFMIENALKFKNKYEEQVSVKCKKGNTIIINN